MAKQITSFPSVTTAEKNAMTVPAGALVFDSTIGALQASTGSAFLSTLAAGLSNSNTFLVGTPALAASTADDGVQGPQANIWWEAQRFKFAANTVINSITIYLKATGGTAGNLAVQIRSSTGSNPNTHPSGTVLATSAIINANTVTTGASALPYTFTFASPFTAVGGTTYWFVFAPAFTSGTVGINLSDSSGGDYGGTNVGGAGNGWQESGDSGASFSGDIATLTLRGSINGSNWTTSSSIAPPTNNTLEIGSSLAAFSTIHGYSFAHYGATSGSVTIKAADVTTSYSVKMPSVQALVGQQLLANTGAGDLVWGSNALSSIAGLFISAPVTTRSTGIASTTFTVFDNSPTLTFTPIFSGIYRISAVIPLENSGDTASTAVTKINNSVGGATLLNENRSTVSDSTNNISSSVKPESYFTLNAGTSYTFNIQGRRTSGTSSVFLDATQATSYMVAEAINGFAASAVCASISDGTTGTVDVFATFNNSPTLTFIPTVTGNYKVHCEFTLKSTNGSTISKARIFNSVGSGTLQAENQVAAYQGHSGTIGQSMSPQSIYTLTAGTSYSFVLQGCFHSGPANAFFADGQFGQFYIFAEQIAKPAISASGDISNRTSTLSTTVYTQFDSFAPTLTFTPSISGIYKVYTVVPIETDEPVIDHAAVRVYNSSGGAALLLENPGTVFTDGTSQGTMYGTPTVTSYYYLSAGTSYSFVLQGKNKSTAGQVHLDGNHALYYIYAELSQIGGGAPVSTSIASTDWANTLTFTPNNFGTITGSNFWWRRVGDSMEIRGNWSAGTVAAAAASITLPPGYVIDSSKLSNQTQHQKIGEYVAARPTGGTAFSGANNFNPIFYDGADTANVYFTAQSAGGSGFFNKDNASAIQSSNGSMHVNISIPIAGWSSNNVTGLNTSKNEVFLMTGNGAGSSRTNVRRWTNVIRNTGSAITYTDSATNGAEFLINEDGVYIIAVNCRFTGAVDTAITKNKTTDFTGAVNAFSGTTDGTVLKFGGTAGASNDGVCVTASYLTAGDVIRFQASATDDSTNFHNTITITKATAVSIGAAGPRSSIRLSGGNGHGSTNTKIRRYVTVVSSVGADMTYTDSAANGMSIVINTPGVYSMYRLERIASGNNEYVGFSVNSSELTTNLDGITNVNRLSGYEFSGVGGAAADGNASVPVILAAGDVIRAHGRGNTVATGDGDVQFIITKISN